MADLTSEIIATITRHKQRLLALQTQQDQLTAELVPLAKNYTAGQVTQAELGRRLAVLTPRQERQQVAIAAALAAIEKLRQQIFQETGRLLVTDGLGLTATRPIFNKRATGRN